MNPSTEALPNDDYDTPWKDAVTRYFPEFIAFYFPDAHRQIDWSRGYTFLDQELAQIVKDAELGKRLIDKLVQVATYDPTFRTTKATISHFGKRVSSEAGVAAVSNASGRE